MIRIIPEGSTRNTDHFLNEILHGDQFRGLHPIAQRGVDVLKAATPRLSGLTAESWSYEIVREQGGVVIWFLNSNSQGGFNVAIGLQYGHGTGHGGWVQGNDYINPALGPTMDALADAVWKEVQNA
jgi:hypothetical protein